MGGTPAADIEAGEDLVRALLESQHPDLAALSLRLLDAGWDNTLWRLGDELLVRLPRREVAAHLVAHEQRWLPELAEHLPLAIPAPVRVGVASDAFPWGWSIVRWVEGGPGDRTPLTNPADAAKRLGGFLRALHQPAPSGAPANPFRGVPLAARQETWSARLAEMAPAVDVDTAVDVETAERVWGEGIAAPVWDGPGVWLHGDLHPANVVVRDGTLAAVIDFGDMCAGDPATDLAGAWLLLPEPEAAYAAYGGVGRDLDRRARAWAALFAVLLISIGLDDKPTYEVVGRAALARLAAAL